MSVDLWSPAREAARKAVEPLALRMRPRSFAEFVGQGHIVGEGRLLRRLIAADRLTSIILHGPPGTGKTTLAEVIANELSAASGVGVRVERENAANVSVKRIREVIDEAAHRLESAPPGKAPRTILFLDEIHRFSKSQQDVLLGDVEKGTIILIGATTENPLFAVNSALVSRSTLFRLEPLTETEVGEVVRRAIGDTERGYGGLDLRVSDDAIEHWARISDGDARRALTALEVAVMSSVEKRAVTPVRANAPDARRDREGALASPIAIDLATAQESIQQKAMVYSADGDEHYDVISAMIKSVRGSDPDAAVYWIARMLESGEDPRFIARRLAILASEDIGNADPRAIMVAAACWELVERIGMPEGRINLAQCAIYLALAPKSNASYKAIDEAMEDVQTGRTVAVPLHLRDSHKARSEGSPEHGRGYEYSHDAMKNTSLGAVTGQDYLGVDKQYYRPAGVGAEEILKKRLEEVRKARGSKA